jgi:hypothetical protein
VIPSWIDSPTGAPLRAELLPEAHGGAYSEPGFTAPVVDAGVVVVSEGVAAGLALRGLGGGGLQATLTQESVYGVLLLDRIDAYEPLASCGADPEGDLASCGPAPAPSAFSAPAPPAPAMWSNE